MLEHKDYGDGIISYCHYCNGFFNMEDEFIEEGSAYWDTRYKRGYWVDMIFNSAIFGAFVLCGTIIFNLSAWTFILNGIIPLIYIFKYFKLKKGNYFIKK